MVRKAARTVKSLEKPQTDSPTSRTRSRRRHKSESEPESEGDVTVSSLKNESSDGSEQEYEKKTRKSDRSTHSKKSHKKKDKSKSITSDDEEEEEVKERKTRKGKSKDKNKRNSKNVNDTEIENDNVQGTDQSPVKDETQDKIIATYLTENSNSEEPLPDNQNDDSVDNATQPMESMVFSSVNVEADGESTCETSFDPLADPLDSQAETNIEDMTKAEEKEDIGNAQNSTINVVESSIDQNSEIGNENEEFRFAADAHNKTDCSRSPTHKKSLRKTEEKQKQSFNVQDEAKSKPVESSNENLLETENKNKSSDELIKPVESAPTKKIQLKRPLSEKRDKSEKQDTEKTEKCEDSKNCNNRKDQTHQGVESHKENKTDTTNDCVKKESSLKRKITLKRSSETRQSSVEEAKKPVSVHNAIKHEENSSNKEENNVVHEENSLNKEKNEEDKEEGEWISSYEANGQNEDLGIKKPRERDDDRSSRRKISLKRRTTTDEKERGDKSRDKAERSISLNESNKERRRSHRDSESDFEIKRRPSKNLDRSVSENDEKIITSVKPKKPTKVVKINRAILKSISKDSELPQVGGNHQEATETTTEEGQTKKYKWGLSEAVIYDTVLDFKIVKKVCPSVEFLKEEEVDLELSSLEKRRLELEKRKLLALERKQEGTEEIEVEDDVIPVEVRENILAKNRNISIVDDTASKLKPPPSPAKNPISNIVFVSNLVRPFTVRQLRELLERTGTIKEDGFWTDKIKSKCFVVYETTEEAEATRNALHGVNWPIGNGKQLVIEYATEEEMDRAKNPPPPVRRERTPEKENKIPDSLDSVKIKEGEAAAAREWDAKRRDSGGDRTRDADGHRRRHSGPERDAERRRSRSRSKERIRKHSRRSLTPEDHHHKRKKHEEPVEQKAMDDLFMKTKATPSIYWQPLSPEEIAQKQRQREARLEENRRRMEERRLPQPTHSSNFRDRNFRRR